MASEAEKMVSDFCAAFARKNIDELMNFFTDDAVYHNIPMGPLRGKAAIRAALNSYLPAAQAVEFKILHSAAAGNLVINERIDAFQMGGKQVQLPVAGVFEVRGGKISAWRDYFDLATWTRQTQ